jgi:hypothetical protein
MTPQQPCQSNILFGSVGPALVLYQCRTDRGELVIIVYPLAIGVTGRFLDVNLAID